MLRGAIVAFGSARALNHGDVGNLYYLSDQQLTDCGYDAVTVNYALAVDNEARVATPPLVVARAEEAAALLHAVTEAALGNRRLPEAEYARLTSLVAYFANLPKPKD